MKKNIFIFIIMFSVVFSFSFSQFSKEEIGHMHSIYEKEVPYLNLDEKKDDDEYEAWKKNNDEYKAWKKDYDEYEAWKKDLEKKFNYPLDASYEILADNINAYFIKKYNNNFSKLVPHYTVYKEVLSPGKPYKSLNGEKLVILEYNLKDYNEGEINTSVPFQEEGNLYKELYLMRRIWDEAKDPSFLSMHEELKATLNQWEPFFENVRAPQFFWEEGTNRWLSEKETIFGISNRLYLYSDEEFKKDIKNEIDERLKKRMEEDDKFKKKIEADEKYKKKAKNEIKKEIMEEKMYILKKPNNYQVTIFHPAPVIEYNEDDSKTLTPALGLQILGLRRFEPDDGYKTSWGASYVINMNSESDDDEFGHGIMINWNQFDIGLIYRNSERVDTKWWLTFGINVAPIIERTNTLPKSLENFKENPKKVYEDYKSLFDELKKQESSSDTTD